MPMGVPSSRWKIRAMPLTPTMGEAGGRSKIDNTDGCQHASGRFQQNIANNFFQQCLDAPWDSFLYLCFLQYARTGRIYAAVPGTGREDIWILIH